MLKIVIRIYILQMICWSFWRENSNIKYLTIQFYQFYQL